MTADLNSYAGRYLGEPGASAEVIPSGPGVAVRFGRGSRGMLELAPVEPDVFRRGSMIAQFHRDAAGEVVSFNYSDPLIPGLQFTRWAARVDR